MHLIMKAIFICTDKRIYDWDTCMPVKTMKYARPKKVEVELAMDDLSEIEHDEMYKLNKKEFVDVYPFYHPDSRRILKGKTVIYTECSFCRYIDPKHKYQMDSYL